MSQETTISGSFVWTLNDAKTRQDVLVGWPVTTRGKVVRYAILLITLVILFTTTNLRSLLKDPYLITISLVGFIILYFIFSYSQSANLKKGFLQSPDSNKRIDITFSQDEILMKAEGIYENKWKWNTVKEVRQYPGGFCFFLAEQAGIWIPIRTFQSQEDINSIVELAKQLTPKFKVSA